MRVVGYLRTSGVGRETSLDAQAEEIRTWCHTEGHELAGLYSDSGVSGEKEANGRPGLAEALTLVEGGGLVVHRLDRLARSITVQEPILAQVWKEDGHVFETVHGEVMRDDPDDPMRTAMREMAAVFARLEKNMVRARLQKGRRDKKKRDPNAYIGGGNHRRFEIPANLPDRIADLRAEGLTTRQIAEQLTVEASQRPRARRSGLTRPLLGTSSS